MLNSTLKHQRLQFRIPHSKLNIFIYIPPPTVRNKLFRCLYYEAVTGDAKDKSYSEFSSAPQVAFNNTESIIVICSYFIS